MKPLITSGEWKNITTGESGRAWFVQFQDTCGCRETEQFATWARALRFAENIIAGVPRWHA